MDVKSKKKLCQGGLYRPNVLHKNSSWIKVIDATMKDITKSNAQNRVVRHCLLRILPILVGTLPFLYIELLIGDSKLYMNFRIFVLVAEHNGNWQPQY